MERLRNIAKNIILAFTLSIAFQILLGNYVVDGNSMDPTLRNDQRVFVNKFVYFDPIVFNSKLNLSFESTLNPKRGDVVVFEYPRDPVYKYVKRCIAIAGDSIRIEDQDIYSTFKLIKKDNMFNKILLINR